MKIIALISVLFLCANALPFGDQLAASQQFNGTIWVVLVAGSNGWYNYRHQADIYHSYQVVRNHGIPEKNIIVFHYDDLAQNEENPTKGQVINKPGGTDVYHGVPKDFVGADVTPKNFLAALKGDQELAKKGKKVVQSGPNDHIFVYFADHGAPDLIAFPSEYLYGEDLNKALEYLHTNNRYSKLVFYLEACESGSMFDKLLPKNINIYATTAANPTESSYACYYDDKRGTYLGDVYSVKWIENSDRKNLGKESLIEQFKVVKQETNTSHVMEYGDLSLGNLPLTQFQGDKQSEHQIIGGNDEYVVPFDAVDSGDVPIKIVEHRVKNARNDEEKKLYSEELERLETGRKFLVYHLEQYINQIQHLVGNEVNSILNTKQEVIQKSCYRTFVDTFHQKCLNLNQHPFVLRKLHVLANVCEVLHRNNNGNDQDMELAIKDAVDHMDSYCHENLDGGYPHRIE